MKNDKKKPGQTKRNHFKYTNKSDLIFFYSIIFPFLPAMRILNNQEAQTTFCTSEECCATCCAQIISDDTFNIQLCNNGCQNVPCTSEDCEVGENLGNVDKQPFVFSGETICCSAEDGLLSGNSCTLGSTSLPEYEVGGNKGDETEADLVLFLSIVIGVLCVGILSLVIIRRKREVPEAIVLDNVVEAEGVNVLNELEEHGNRKSTVSVDSLAKFEPNYDDL
eukprot:snap_masked-scaffold_14-processed-gene-0.24-mRNA-1 protein AED:1.00 eAED:1.00 QI:0/0/0/0/1/1/2/0/221